MLIFGVEAILLRLSRRTINSFQSIQALKTNTNPSKQFDSHLNQNQIRIFNDNRFLILIKFKIIETNNKFICITDKTHRQEDLGRPLKTSDSTIYMVY